MKLPSEKIIAVKEPEQVVAPILEVAVNKISEPPVEVKYQAEPIEEKPIVSKPI
jgi:hypothetical protein